MAARGVDDFHSRKRAGAAGCVVELVLAENAEHRVGRKHLDRASDRVASGRHAKPPLDGNMESCLLLWCEKRQETDASLGLCIELRPGKGQNVRAEGVTDQHDRQFSGWVGVGNELSDIEA